MQRFILLVATMGIVGGLTYLVMIFTGNTPKVSKGVEVEIGAMYENSYSNQALLEALKTASLIAQKPTKLEKIKNLFSELSYYSACIQILELERDPQKIRGLIMNLMMKQKELSTGYMTALDTLRQAGQKPFRNDTERPDMTFGHCQLKMSDGEKLVYLQRWKDMSLKDRTL